MFAEPENHPTAAAISRVLAALRSTALSIRIHRSSDLSARHCQLGHIDGSILRTDFQEMSRNLKCDVGFQKLLTYLAEKLRVCQMLEIWGASPHSLRSGVGELLSGRGGNRGIHVHPGEVQGRPRGPHQAAGHGRPLTKNLIELILENHIIN